MVSFVRHVPTEATFRKTHSLLAGERLDLFNAYQAYQRETVERSFAAMTGGWLASFIAQGPGRAIFVGVYEIAGSRRFSLDEFWALPENIELRTLGIRGFTAEDGRDSILRFDLRLTSFRENWRGKLIIGWPPLDRSC
jgi:hypothetical protein